MIQTNAYLLLIFFVQVDADNFVSIVDNLAKEDVTVVVHLFAPDLTHCVELHSMLNSLAAIEFQHTKFVCLDIAKNNIKVDKVALPMLQLYRGGDLVDTVAAVHLEVDISVDSSNHN